MAQMTVRLDDELAKRLKGAAKAAGKSVNSWVTTVLAAASDPDLQSDELERIRERLRLAGLLFESDKRVERPSRERIARASAAAAKGTPLSDLVTEGRR